MGTTLIQDETAFDTLRNSYPVKPLKLGGGRLIFAGNLWPVKNTQKPNPHWTHDQLAQYKLQQRVFNTAALARRDAEVAFQEARSMAVKALIVAKAGLRGDKEAVAMMTRWFGPRPARPITQGRDWWEGAARIIGVVESFVTSDVSAYYRGDDSLIGKPNDYPGETGNLTARDVSGYAESSAGAKDKVIGLCKLFFAKKDANGQARMNLRGKDSVGGTLVHELSHNLCKTEDHEAMDGSECYGTEDCLKLAGLPARPGGHGQPEIPAKPGLPRRAWYNADNIEYFCEEVYYGGFDSGLTETTPTTSNVSAKRQLVAAVLERTFHH